MLVEVAVRPVSSTRAHDSAGAHAPAHLADRGQTYDRASVSPSRQNRQRDGQSRGSLLERLPEDRVGEQEPDRVRALRVQRLVGEGGEHGAEALVRAFAELAVREDVEVVASD